MIASFTHALVSVISCTFSVRWHTRWCTHMKWAQDRLRELGAETSILAVSSHLPLSSPYPGEVVCQDNSRVPVSTLLPNSVTAFYIWKDNASLVGGKNSGARDLINNRERALFTVVTSCVLYSLHTNFSVSALVSLARLPFLGSFRSSWCCSKTFHADFLLWPDKKDMTSPSPSLPVRAWNAGRVSKLLAHTASAQQCYELEYTSSFLTCLLQPFHP